jgi:hypothetical protein
MRVERPSIIGEFEDVDLGDERLNARCLLLAESMARDPELSFPDALEDSAELEGGYRFLNNERVDADEILRPHVAATGARLRAAKVVLALHDTTEFIFGGSVAREGLEGDRFRSHFCLGVSADGRREPLGVLAIDSWVRTERKGKRSYQERRKETDRESNRWLAQSIDVENLAESAQLIHVEDREADIYESIEARIQHNMRFIVRAQHYRLVEIRTGSENLRDFMRQQPRRFERIVTLSRRQKPHSKTSNQERDGRKANLSFASASVNIRRPGKISATGAPSVAVNIVHVIEPNPPEGEQAVEWLLMTTEPVVTDADVEFVVDSYRARWVIEEYFKALKTGCAYEARQLESYDALRRALSIFAVIAWRLLWMRFLAQNAPSTPATLVATKAELEFLVAQGRLNGDANVNEFLKAIARLGGHIKNNGPPGWQVLWRGYRKLNDLAAGFALAKSLIEK